MKNIILMITLLMLLACKKQEETKFQDSKIKDINQIVEAIINQDSLNVSKNKPNSIAFCTDLIKINILIPTKTDEKLDVPPPIPPNNVSINELLNFKIKENFFFSKIDSTYLISQNVERKEFIIERKIVEEINTTTLDKEIVKKNKEKYNFYQMTIPLFSKNMNKAYVELYHYCGGLCGEGKAIFLSKINGKWRIVNKYRTWIS
jgi:hypothetical protein